jgi:hypothetical protein
MCLECSIPFSLTDLLETNIKLIAVISNHDDDDLLAHADVVAYTTSPSDINFRCGEHDFVVSISRQRTIDSRVGDPLDSGDD